MIVQESGFEFDFSEAVSCEKHDNGKNSIFPGVDFEIQTVEGDWIWLEVKNWEPSGLEARRRGAARRSFLSKIHRSKSTSKNRPTQSKVFYEELRNKFIGTSAFLSLTGAFPADPITYVILMESPLFTDERKLLVRDEMRKLLRFGLRSAPWTLSLDVLVLDRNDWTNEFPEFPATLL